MSDYFSQYGNTGQTREKIIRWVLITMVLVALLWVADWGLGVNGTYNLRDWHEQYRAHQFFSLLGDKQYAAAYGLWGCDITHPCRDYSFQKFMEDWGPKSPAASLASRKVLSVRHCGTGVIESIDLGSGDPVNLHIDAGDLTIGFAPWPICNPHWQAPAP